MCQWGRRFLTQTTMCVTGDDGCIKSWMCFFMSKKKKELCNNKNTRYKINNCKMQENVILLT